MKKQVIIIGGGAAGFFCAANIDEGKYEVTILEKQTKVLQKVRVSGGGRCNVTHDCADPAEMVKAYPRGSKQLRQAFSRFFTSDTRAWFQSRGLKLKAERDGRMFPVTDRSEDVIEVLTDAINRKGFKVWTSSGVKEIRSKDSGFEVELENGNVLNADKVLVAAGGYAKIDQFNWLVKLGHSIVNPVPSLFTFNVPDPKIHDLKGNSVEWVDAKIAGSSYVSSGPVLFTHWGFSGPAILRLSSVHARDLADKNYEFDFFIKWIPSIRQEELKSKLERFSTENGEKKVVNLSPFNFSSTIWNYLVSRAKIDSETRWKDVKGKKLNLLVELLFNDMYHASGKTTFKEEFVTCGGIDLKEIDFKSMESRKVPGLYFAGEVLDIDGITGGYNFQAAWTTGFIAASHISSGA